MDNLKTLMTFAAYNADGAHLGRESTSREG
jgi:hypothetical protein